MSEQKTAKEFSLKQKWTLVSLRSDVELFLTYAMNFVQNLIFVFASVVKVTAWRTVTNAARIDCVKTKKLSIAVIFFYQCSDLRCWTATSMTRSRRRIFIDNYNGTLLEVNLIQSVLIHCIEENKTAEPCSNACLSCHLQRQTEPCKIHKKNRNFPTSAHFIQCKSNRWQQEKWTMDSLKISRTDVQIFNLSFINPGLK